MKKVLFFTLTAILLSGCEPKSHTMVDGHLAYSYYNWINDSDHTVGLSLSGANLYSDRGEYGDYKNEKEGFERVLEPGESYADSCLLITMNSPAHPPFTSPFWKMTVLFDDQIQCRVQSPNRTE